MNHSEFTDDTDNYYDYHYFAAEAGAWLIDNALESQTPKIGSLVIRASLDVYLRAKTVEAQQILKERENPCADWQPHAWHAKHYVIENLHDEIIARFVG